MVRPAHGDWRGDHGPRSIYGLEGALEVTLPSDIGRWLRYIGNDAIPSTHFPARAQTSTTASDFYLAVTPTHTFSSRTRRRQHITSTLTLHQW